MAKLYLQWYLWASVVRRLFYTALARPSTQLNFLVCHNQNPVRFPNLLNIIELQRKDLIYTTLILSYTETTFMVFHNYIPVRFPYLMCMKTARNAEKLHHLHRPQICIKLPWILKGIKLNTHSRHMRVSIDGTSIRCENIGPMYHRQRFEGLALCYLN